MDLKGQLLGWSKDLVGQRVHLVKQFICMTFEQISRVNFINFSFNETFLLMLLKVSDAFLCASINLL